MTVFFKLFPALIDCNNKPLPWSPPAAFAILNVGGGGGGGADIINTYVPIKIIKYLLTHLIG